MIQNIVLTFINIIYLTFIVVSLSPISTDGGSVRSNKNSFRATSSVDGSLYSDFNRRLEEISNYVKNRYDSDLILPVDAMYDLNGNRVLQQLKHKNQNHMGEREEKKELLQGSNFPGTRKKNAKQNNSSKTLKSPLKITDTQSQFPNARNHVKRSNPRMYHDSSSSATSTRFRIPWSLEAAVVSQPFSTTSVYDSNINANDYKSYAKNELSKPKDLWLDTKYHSSHRRNAKEDYDSSSYPNILTTELRKHPLTIQTTNPEETPALRSLPSLAQPYPTPSENDILSKIGILNSQIMTVKATNDANISNARILKEAPSLPQMLPVQGSNLEQEYRQNITSILEKVLLELEKIKSAQKGLTNHSEGAPCDIFGSWNSQVIGLKFNIEKSKPTAKHTCDLGNLTIKVVNRLSIKKVNFIDCTWRCSGSAQKQYGGPIFMLARKPEANSMATFAGFCKTCGGIDTIFGSWTFVFPSQDCQDVSISIENRRDVLRRSSFEAKKEIKGKQKN